LAADKAIGLSGTQKTNVKASSPGSKQLSDRETTEELLAQHALFTSDLVFDLTEQTTEHSEMEGVAKILLERYREDIERERAHVPCQALDDEFVREFARKEVEINPCQGPLSYP